MANRNLEKSEISEISEKLFGIFLFTSFRFFPTGKIQNSDLKISEKISEIFEVSEFSVWPSLKAISSAKTKKLETLFLNIYTSPGYSILTTKQFNSQSMGRPHK